MQDQYQDNILSEPLRICNEIPTIYMYIVCTIIHTTKAREDVIL